VLPATQIYKAMVERVKNLTVTNAILRGIVVCLFVFAQFLSSAHAHDADHHDETDEPPVCAFCIINLNEDDDPEIDEPDLADDLDISSIVDISHTVVRELTDTDSTAPTGLPNLVWETSAKRYLDAARAPPMDHILS